MTRSPWCRALTWLAFPLNWVWLVVTTVTLVPNDVWQPKVLVAVATLFTVPDRVTMPLGVGVAVGVALSVGVPVGPDVVLVAVLMELLATVAVEVGVACGT